MMTTGKQEPRAYTTEELREQFLDHARYVARYWAHADRGDMSVEERTSGAVFSILTAIDGCSGALPGFHLTASPHADDKAYLANLGENWIEPGTCITEDAMLHEMFYREAPHA